MTVSCPISTKYLLFAEHRDRWWRYLNVNERDMDAVPIVLAFIVGYRQVNSQSQNDMGNTIREEIQGAHHKHTSPRLLLCG